MIRLWRNAWNEFIPFLDYDVEIRTVICSTNAIESLNARYRRAVRARGHFPTEQAAMKCLYFVTRSLHPAGRPPRTTNRMPETPFAWLWRWVCQYNGVTQVVENYLRAGASRPSKVISKAFSAGFQRIVQRLRPWPVGSRLITAR
jgi:hypothetical protein